MPRTFDGTNDSLHTTPGALASMTFGTFAVICKRNQTTYGNLLTLHTSAGTSRLGLEIESNGDGNNLQWQYDASFVASTFTVVNADGWVLLAMGKATGTTTPRCHKYVYSTNTWTHQDAAGTATNSTAVGGTGTMRFGEWEGSDDFNGDLAVAGAWSGRNLSDAEVEALAFSLMGWITAAPDALWVFDQAATTTKLLDLTGGGANESALTGTSVSTNSLPVFGYGHPVLRASTSASADIRAVSGVTTCGLTSAGTAAKKAPQAGTTSTGLSTSAGAAKLTPAVGTTPTGLSSTGAAGRKAPGTATAAAGLASSATTVKVAPQGGTSTLGVAGTTGTLQRTAAQSGTTSLGLSSAATASKIATTTGQCAIGLAGIGAAGKATASTGTTSLGLSSAGVTSSSDAVAQTGQATLGLSTTATVTKTARPFGTASLGLASTASAARIAPVIGTCTTGLATTAAPAKSAPTAGSTPLGCVTTGPAAKRAPTGGSATAGLAGTAAGTHHGAPAATGSLGLTSTGTPSGRHAGTGTTTVGLAGSGGAGKTTTAAGHTPIGLASAGTPAVPVPVTTSPLYDAVKALLDCVNAALAATAAGAPDRVCVVAGELAWDECECGLLAATVGRRYPSRTFPTDASRDPTLASCPAPLLASPVTLTVLRCAPSPDLSGNPPTCEQLSAAAATWRADAAAVLVAVACCLAGLVDDGTIEAFTIGALTKVGPQGGCVGFEHQVTLGLCNPACPT